jgi:hypothetical protein
VTAQLRERVRVRKSMTRVKVTMKYITVLKILFQEVTKNEVLPPPSPLSMTTHASSTN